MMAEIPTGKHTDELTAQALRNDLARGDEAIAASYPMLRGLLFSGPSPWLNEELVARVRGMILDIARQMLVVSGDLGTDSVALARRADLAEGLLDSPVILGHAQCLALEAQLAEQMQLRSGLDPALSLLLQERLAAADGLARPVLGAQLSFIQSCSRMELPLPELPSEALHSALSVMRDFAAANADVADTIERQLSATYDERSGRLGLMERFVASLDDPEAALDLHHAGLALFATALAMASGQERELVIMALSGRQSTRLGLALLAAGISADEVMRQLQLIDPALALPPGFAAVDGNDAADLLRASELGGSRDG